MAIQRTHLTSHFHGIMIAALGLLCVNLASAPPILGGNDLSRFSYKPSAVVIEYIVTPKMKRGQVTAIHLKMYGDGKLEVESYGKRLEGKALSQGQMQALLLLFEENGLMSTTKDIVDIDLRDFRRNHRDRGAIADGSIVDLKVHLDIYQPRNANKVSSNYHRSLSLDNPLINAEKYPEVESVRKIGACVAELHALYLATVFANLDEAAREEIFK